MYVGQTTQTPNQRFCQHRRDARSDKRRKLTISHAIHKYGWTGFTNHILEVCESQDELDNAEKYWISHYECRAPHGYNLDAGGRGSGIKADETRAKMSKSKMGHATSDAAKEKLSKAHKGKQRPPEVIQKMKEGMAKRMARLGKDNKGCGPIKHSEETKEKIANSLRGRKMSAESRRKRDETYAKKRLAKLLRESETCQMSSEKSSPY